MKTAIKINRRTGWKSIPNPAECSSNGDHAAVKAVAGLPNKA
ncbi:MAG: hypothetical protein WBW41_13455 [Verrucomicrobiia bacterium]